MMRIENEKCWLVVGGFFLGFRGKNKKVKLQKYVKSYDLRRTF